LLLAQRFDASRQELQGDPLTILSLAKNDLVPAGRRLFSVSSNGVLIWQGVWSRSYQLVWRDRGGRPMGAVGPVVNQTGDGQEPRLSPDGKRLAFKRDNAIWVTEVARDVPVRLMGGQLPVWSPDGTRVALLAAGLRLMAANGVGEQENLVDGVSAPTDWSLDGRFLLFWRRGEKTRTDIWALPLFGERKPYPLLNSPANEELARFSPDGHWLAYTSDESGSQEVYVRSFTSEGRAGADRKRISSRGGFQPMCPRMGSVF
jgi:Tol biopolymer transport system component